jgi:hypothetical protein
LQADTALFKEMGKATPDLIILDVICDDACHISLSTMPYKEYSVSMHVSSHRPFH